MLLFRWTLDFRITEVRFRSKFPPGTGGVLVLVPVVLSLCRLRKPFNLDQPSRYLTYFDDIYELYKLLFSLNWVLSFSVTICHAADGDHSNAHLEILDAQMSVYWLEATWTFLLHSVIRRRIKPNCGLVYQWMKSTERSFEDKLIIKMADMRLFREFEKTA